MATPILAGAETKSGVVTARAASALNLGVGVSCREAAEAAANMYDTSEPEKHAQVIAEAWKAKLIAQSKTYTRLLMAKARQLQNQLTHTNGNGEVTEAAEPQSSFFGISYPWWDLLIAGPFQPVAPLGPFQPQKIIRHGEPSFLLAAFWRNPAPLPGGPNPSAAQIMAPFSCQLRFESINLSSVTDGPDFIPAPFAFGGGNVNVSVIPMPTASFSAPSQGVPQLYEVNATADIVGPGPGLPPFAGFSTAVYDPDIDPPFLISPGAPPRIQLDIPLRFMRYV